MYRNIYNLYFYKSWTLKISKTSTLPDVAGLPDKSGYFRPSKNNFPQLPNSCVVADRTF